MTSSGLELKLGRGLALFNDTLEPQILEYKVLYFDEQGFLASRALDFVLWTGPNPGGNVTQSATGGPEVAIMHLSLSRVSGLIVGNVVLVGLGTFAQVSNTTPPFRVIIEFDATGNIAKGFSNFTGFLGMGADVTRNILPEHRLMFMPSRDVYPPIQADYNIKHQVHKVYLSATGTTGYNYEEPSLPITLKIGLNTNVSAPNKYSLALIWGPFTSLPSATNFQPTTATFSFIPDS